MRTTWLFASPFDSINAFPYFIVVPMSAWRSNFCCTPRGAPVPSSHVRYVGRFPSLNSLKRSSTHADRCACGQWR